MGTVLLLSLTPKPICGWVGSHEAKQELDGKSMTSKLFSVTMLCLQCPGLFSALCRTGTRSDLFRRDSKSVTTNAVSGGEGLELELVYGARKFPGGGCERSWCVKHGNLRGWVDVCY